MNCLQVRTLRMLIIEARISEKDEVETEQKKRERVACPLSGRLCKGGLLPCVDPHPTVVAEMKRVIGRSLLPAEDLEAFGALPKLSSMLDVIAAFTLRNREIVPVILLHRVCSLR